MKTSTSGGGKKPPPTTTDVPASPGDKPPRRRPNDRFQEGQKNPHKPVQHVTCETLAAVVVHLRVVTDEFPIKLGGHYPKPNSVCGSVVSWDCRFPIIEANITCRDCRAYFVSLQQ